MTKTISTIFLCCLLFFVGCKKRPQGVLSENKMVDLLTDLQMAQAYQSTTQAGHDHVNRETMTEAVLTKHGVSREELDSTMAYYGRNIDDYYLLYQKVEHKLRAMSGREEESATEDDIWPYNKFAAFLQGQFNDGITFSIPAEDLTPGETVSWKLRLSSAEGVEALLGVEYENGIASYVKKNSAGNQNLNLNLMTDTAMQPKRIYGYMTVAHASLPLWVDSIRLVKMEFDSLEYSRISSQKRIYPPTPKPIVKIEEKDSVIIPSIKNM